MIDTTTKYPTKQKDSEQDTATHDGWRSQKASPKLQDDVPKVDKPTTLRNTQTTSGTASGSNNRKFNQPPSASGRPMD